MTNDSVGNFAREFSKRLNIRWNKGDKGTIWICTTTHPVVKYSKKSKCSCCGITIYYDPLIKNNFKKNHKKICIDCALKRDDLNEEQRAILDKVWCNSGNIGAKK